MSIIILEHLLMVWWRFVCVPGDLLFFLLLQAMYLSLPRRRVKEVRLASLLM